ncbi:hypothetical protein EQO05_09460 [Methanosarcina sp. MSH10X1]|uniref:DUF7286 family protein n=1 Tax=Methanosarcina sp. MSH10X1 TaxID=2507075 RepID=UPI000FFBBCB7|nr:hypothetical protein [Methanosarcina sp. MSH10X1]RXA19341.1 hypothetical protein EQO05_09460 [Methanosarcina sp. MSH10X1]
MAGKPYNFSFFIEDTCAYIPYAVIGIFILLIATFTSVYLLKIDSEVAETIYTTGNIDPEKSAINLASFDLARCLNYAGMEALEWQGEHPVILPEGSTADRSSEDGFLVIPQNQNLEKGDLLQVSINLPSDIWGKIEALWKNRDIRLVVNDSSGYEIKSINYGQATGFFRKVSLQENVEIPDSAASGYASIELYYGNELKASDWFVIEISPVKDITADAFNRLLSVNYQGNSHTFREYAINVESYIKPEQIKIKKVTGTLQREISSGGKNKNYADTNPAFDTDYNTPAGKNYTIYYVFEIPVLNYTLVNLESGESFNRSMKLSTMITSREPLLEELVREYETELGNTSSLDSTSNLVLGATNLRTFVYGPWQHYANGPLNILTNPALSSSINGAMLYTQKRIFDSVDPLALTYTTYYNGKVLYEDVSTSSSTSGRGKLPSGSNSKLNASISRYEQDKGVNLTTTYDSLAQNKSFSLDVEKSIEESLRETNTSFEQLSEYSKIEVSASNYTDGVIDGWVFNDHVWTEKNPDLIHAVTDSVYMASVQGQILRDGFDSPDPVASEVIANFNPDSVSFSGQTVSWSSNYLASGTHIGSLVPSYSWRDSTGRSYSESLNPSIEPPEGTVSSWSVTSADVSLSSVNIADVKIEPHFSYAGNDTLTVENRSEGYLNCEDHVFDWRIRYDISYKVVTNWKIDYSYDYTYKWKTREQLPDGNYTTVTHYDTSDGSDSQTISKTNIESLSHTETEAEKLTVVYHKRPPAGGYIGLSTYSDPIEREYRETTLYLDSTGDTTDIANDSERFDPCCSDAADKYRDEYLDLRAIESTFWAYPDRQYLSKHAVNCDIPSWLHKIMAEEVLAMLDSVEKNNLTFNYSLIDSPGQDPTDLQVETAEKLISELQKYREAYVNREQCLTSSGKIYASSDSARYIAKNEAYNRLIEDIDRKNRKLDSDLNSYIFKALEKKGIDTSSFDSVTSGPMTLFNNPAVERAASVLGEDMGIISTMTVTGQPESKYNWTENLTIIVDQKPNYLYHDPDFDLREEYEWVDPMSKRTIYPLGIRNTCIFTTGISEEIADGIASSDEYVKTETSQQISQSISNLNAEVFLFKQNLSEQNISLDTTRLNTEVYNLKHTYVQEMRSQVTENVVEEVNSNPVISGWIKEDEVRVATASYLNSLSDDQIIQKSTTDELAVEITSVIKTEIRSLSPPVEPDELEATLNRVDTDIRIGVANGICAVTVSRGELLDSGFGRVDNELKNLANKTVDTCSGELESKVLKRLDRTMATVPCGLPVLPPHWVFTINVWTYEIIGEYEEFTVIDNDNEVIPKPYFGHKGQKYIRKYSEIFDPIKVNERGYSLKLGTNSPINFKFSGYAATVVGPGVKGVGDKEGDRSEQSVGYESLMKKYGELL